LCTKGSGGAGVRLACLERATTRWKGHKHPRTWGSIAYIANQAMLPPALS